MKKLITTLLASFGLAACTTDPPRSIEWFTEHEAERNSVLADCARNAAPESIECLNAQKAEDALALKRRGYVKPQPVDFGEGD